MTHHVPTWAQPLLLAAVFVWRIVSETGGPLFTDPLGSISLPSLTDFAESCKLRPPQPPRTPRLACPDPNPGDDLAFQPRSLRPVLGDARA